MNKVIVLIIIILLIIGAVALNKIINSPGTDNTQTNPENTQVVSNPVQDNSNNNTSTSRPNIPTTYVSQK
ncbi:hypothetical protein [Methanobacterium sp.]|uniref:hypothetical protein n=1 Tax=Methanobacterium sp. TaxID=2164 RepID=UPI0025E26981|nr:hypothetical protein [Methanobacterium sp.]MBI5460408.1 hypothetical protein [Methanobacterium sp.]MDY9922358.1 hypothetical protein [Methanobacterium sp.]